MVNLVRQPKAINLEFADLCPDGENDKAGDGEGANRDGDHFCLLAISKPAKKIAKASPITCQYVSVI